MKKLVSIALAAVVTVLALVYSFWDVDFPQLLSLLVKANYWMVFPYMLFLFLFMYFTVLRWRLLLRPLGEFSLREVTPATLIGFAGNNVLPAHLGEFVRTYIFAQTFQKSKSSVLTTQVLERMLDVLVILLLFFVAVFSIDEFPESIRVGSYLTALVFLGISAAIVVLLIFPASVTFLAEKLTGWLPQSVHDWIMGQIREVTLGMASLKSTRLLIWMIGYSGLKWLANSGGILVALWAYGAEVPISASMIVVAVGALAVTLPSAPGYFGSIQAAFVFALTPFGVEKEAALAASIFVLVAQWVTVTPIGAYFFLTAKSGLRSREKETSELPQAEAEPN